MSSRKATLRLILIASVLLVNVLVTFLLARELLQDKQLHERDAGTPTITAQEA